MSLRSQLLRHLVAALAGACKSTTPHPRVLITPSGHAWSITGEALASALVTAHSSSRPPQTLSALLCRLVTLVTTLNCCTSGASRTHTHQSNNSLYTLHTGG
eukprot:6463875-Amphidinium_carterae.1